MAKSAYRGGHLADGTPLNVAVYRAYRNAGLSHSQALAITAEVGRENSYNPDVLFGSHIDSNRWNVGMLSWNHDRAKNAVNFFNKAGVMQGGKMQRNQANLNAQAAFSVQEMKGAYRNKLKYFWNNPDANPESYAQELGKRYIGWAYGQSEITGKYGGRVPFNWQQHDGKRRVFLNVLGGMLGGKNNYAPMPQDDNFAPPQLQSGFDAFAAQFKPAFEPPELQSGFDEVAQQPMTFEEPQLQSGFDGLGQSEFTEPQLQSGFDALSYG